MVRGGQQKGASAPMEIGLEARAQLRAVALDTNATDRGHVDLGKLTTLATRLQGIGLPLWVPEPVAWEWAEHAARQWSEFTATATQPYRLLRNAGIDLPMIPFAQDVDDIKDEVLAGLAAIDNLVVIPLSPDNALEALKDQTLQRPPGRFKGTDSKDGPTKTGASDSAWLRELRDRADGDLSQILLVSSDGDVLDACAHWGIAPPLLRTWKQLLPTLFTFTLDNGNGRVTRLIIEFLRARLGQSDPTAPCGFTITTDPAQLLFLVDDYLDGADGPVTSANVTELTTLAGIINVVVQELDSAVPAERAVALGVTHSARACVFFLGIVEVAFIHDGRTHSVRITDVLVRTEMSFEVRDGAAVVGAESLADAAIIQQDLYPEAPDALQSVAEALSTVPLLGFPDEWPGEETELHLTGPGGEDVVVGLEGNGWDWSLSVTIGDDTAEVSSEYAEDARLMYRGDPDGWEPPIQIRVDQGALSPRSTDWSLAAWTLAHLNYDTNAVMSTATEDV